MLNRLSNALAKAVSNHGKLPKFIVVVLDTDLVEFIGYDGPWIASLLGELTEWLVKSFGSIVKNQIDKLPDRAKKSGYPQFYWVALPHHGHFVDNFTRTIIINCLEAVFKLYPDFRVIRMKEIWDYDNKDLVDVNGYITTAGYYTYWRSVDAAIKYNAKKRDLFLARNAIKSLVPLQMANDGQANNQDKMPEFFSKKRKQRFSSNNKGGVKRHKLPTPTKFIN